MTQSLPATAYYTTMSRQAIRRIAIAAVLVGLCAAGVHVLERGLGLTFDKPPMPLSKPLPLLSAQLGATFVADGPDENMKPDLLDVLKTREYLLRAYRDTGKKRGEVGEKVHLNLNYYDTGAASPHVPEICWAGSGLVEKGGTRHIFTVPKVRRKDGSVIDVRMTMVSFLPRVTDEDEAFSANEDEKRLLNVAYLFHVNGNYVATPQEVTSTFWKAENKHAYHCKIEVSLKERYCEPDEAERVISEFIRAAIPEIEECLPDPRRLNDDTVDAATAASTRP